MNIHRFSLRATAVPNIFVLAACPNISTLSPGPSSSNRKSYEKTKPKSHSNMLAVQYPSASRRRFKRYQFRRSYQTLTSFGAEDSEDCSSRGKLSTTALISIDSRGGVVASAVGSGKEQCAESVGFNYSITVPTKRGCVGKWVLGIRR